MGTVLEGGEGGEGGRGGRGGREVGRKGCGEGGEVGGAKRVREGRVRRLFRVHELAFEFYLELGNSSKSKRADECYSFRLRFTS